MICKCLPQHSHHLRASFCCMFQSHSICGRGLVLGEGGVRGKRRGRAWGLSPRAVYIPQWSSPFSGPSSQESFTSPLRGVPTREHTLPSAGLSAADRAFPTVGSRHGEGGRGNTPVYTPQQQLHVCTIQPSFKCFSRHHSYRVYTSPRTRTGRSSNMSSVPQASEAPYNCFALRPSSCSSGT